MQVHLNQRVPLTDGIELAADVWLPDGPGPWPVVLIRTPYHRVNQCAAASPFTARGLAYVVQDVRGKFDSDGLFAPLEQEAADGHDTLDWVANQRWCNGRVGMFGRSYLGIVQLPAASGGHEALRCVLPGVAPVDFFNDWIRYDGCFALANTLRWPFEHTTQRTRQGTSHFSWPRMWQSSLGASLTEMETRLGASLPVVRKWLDHDQLDDYWRGLDQRRHFSSVRCPGMHLAGYFDHLSRGQFTAFNGLRHEGATEEARTGQHLLVGPWGHSSTVATTYGDLDFGAASAVPHVEYALRFLDFWLRDIDDGVSAEPAVRYFLIGENRWAHATTWPPTGAEERVWHLASDGSAVGLGSTGRLTEAEAVGAETDEFRYDPADPVYTNGGQVYWGLNEMVPVGPTEQHGTLNRPDVLFYRSEPLSAPLTVAGPVALELWVSSSAPDTDFVTKLCVVDSFGSVYALSVGSLRCRFRNSRADPEPLRQGTAEELTIQMNHVAYRFPAGSRIGLMVTSSCFPRILPHDNRYEPTWSGADPVAATQTIHHSAAHPSRLILQTLPR